MPRKNISKIDFDIGHNEETMQYFTDLAKQHKKQMDIQAEEMKKVSNKKYQDRTSWYGRL